MNDEQIKNLQKEYQQNLKFFNELIQAQDLIRRVYCYQCSESEIDRQLKHIDKLLTKTINHFGSKTGSVTGEAKKVWPHEN